MGQLLEELKRRNVIRVGTAYLVIGWVVMQVIDVIVEPLRLPEWTATLVIVLLLIGLPITLFLAWAFERTPDGVKRTEDVDPEYSVTPATGQKLNYVIIGALVLAVAGLLYDRSAPRSTEDAPEDVPEIVAAAEPVEASIAVLPFVNMSSDPEQEYFSDGISEGLLNVLAKIDSLKVAARTSLFSFKGQNRPIGEIAEVLGVGHILEGSVRKAGNQIRITAQLIRVSDGFHMWSDTYDRELVNIFAIQDEIAQAIASELRVRLTDEQQVSVASASTTNAEAYQEYLNGRYFWNLRTTDYLYQAADHFEQAAELDPEYADAWLGLAETFVLLPVYEFDDAKAADQFGRSRRAAERALEINPRSGRAYAVLGGLYQKGLEWRESLASFKLAIQFEPEHATNWHWYGGVLMDLGRYDESLSAYQKALELDPLSRIININAAETLLGAGKYDEALIGIEKTLSIAPDFNYAWEIKGYVHLIRQEFEEAREAFRTMARLNGDETNPLLDSVDFVEALAAGNDPVILPELLEELGQYDPYLTAPILVSAGQYEAALDFVERQTRTNIPEAPVLYLTSDLFKQAMGDMPRYQELVKRLATVEGGRD